MKECRLWFLLKEDILEAVIAVEAIEVILGEGLTVEAEENRIIPESKVSQEVIIHPARIHQAVLQALQAEKAAAGQAAKACTAMEEAIQATGEAIVLEEDSDDLMEILILISI